MNRTLIIIIIFLVGGGYYFLTEKKEKDLAKKICSEHFKTTESICIEEYWNYAFRLSSKLAKKNLIEYIKKVKSIENKISQIKEVPIDIDFTDYEPLSISGMDILKKEYKKVIIKSVTTDDFFEPSCRFVYDYQLCMTSKVYDYNNDQEVINTEVIEIKNIEKFDEVKKILDELHKLNFRYYKLIVYGDLKKGIIDSKIDADFIKLEKINLKNSAYETALTVGLNIIKEDEFKKYFKKEFPNKQIPRTTNSIFYK